MDIKVLGSCCGKCEQLEKLARQAVQEMGVEASVEKVSELADIMAYGIMSTPGLVVNGELRLAGRVPKLEELKTILARAGA